MELLNSRARRDANNAPPNSSTLSTRNSGAIANTIARYGDADRFLLTFNPSNQPRFCATENIARCIKGDAPSLGVVAQTYGQHVATSWLTIQLQDLGEFAGVAEKMSVQKAYACAEVIASQFGFLKVSELMLFFMHCKAGRYGHFYGAVDPMRITEALHDFLRWRAGEISRIEAEQERAEGERAALEHRSTAVSWEEFAASRGITDENPLKMLTNG